MRFEIVFTESYTRRSIRLLREHPELRTQYRKTLELLVEGDKILPVNIGKCEDVY
jgi:hypothetical protein